MNLKTAALVVLFSVSSSFAALTPVGLKCDYAVNPLGVDEQKPRLSWQLESKERNSGSRREKLADETRRC